MSVTAIIPARFASTRFPGKPLADILGKPMIQHVYERVSQSTSVERVIVATDDERIRSAVVGFGGDVVMTCADHPTGTDRLAEVAEQLDSQIIVNVQGDEPLIDPGMIDLATAPLLEDDAIPMGTLKAAISDPEDFSNPNVVKVVTTQAGFALYFSRSLIPYPRDSAGGANDAMTIMSPSPVFKHIGLYVYRRDFLLKFPKLPETPLERLEQLEQLRALENGYRIRVVETLSTSQGVDVPEDLERVKKILSSV
jgi:3-deoxy-manno-octulosonate cytidylyltransferase (CMP-KDO synthetase)